METLNDLGMKFYSRDSSFMNFKKISYERAMEIKSEGILFRNNFLDSCPVKSNTLLTPKAELYNALLRYLLNPKIGLKYRSFDERVIFYLYVMDPDMDVMNYYLNMEHPKKPLVNPYDFSVDGDDVQEELNQYYYQVDLSKSEFRNIIRKNIGFYTPYLFKYEKIFFEKYLLDKELINNSNILFDSSLINLFNCVTNFNHIDIERYNEIKRITDFYSLNDYDYSTSLYHIFKQFSLLGLNTSQEQALFFILVNDPNLDILGNHFESCNLKDVYKFMFDRFGFVSEKAYLVEKEYRDKFRPDISFDFDDFTQKNKR